MLHSFQKAKDKKGKHKGQERQEIDRINMLSHDLKTYLFGCFDFDSLQTAEAVCTNWYTLLKTDPAPWSLKLSNSLPSYGLNPNFPKGKFRQMFLALYNKMLRQKSIVSPDGEGSPYLLQALEGNIEALTNIPLRQDTLNRLYMVSLAGHRGAQVGHHLQIPHYAVLLIKVAIELYNIELIEQLAHFKMRENEMLDILIFAKMQANKEIFHIVLKAIIRGRYQWDQYHPALQYIELALQGNLLAIENAMQLDEAQKQTLYMLAVANQSEQYHFHQFDAETLADLMIFSSAFCNHAMMDALIKEFYGQTESTYSDILAAACKNGDIELITVILMALSDTGSINFIEVMRSATNQLCDAYDCDFRFVEIAKKMMAEKFPAIPRSIFSDANFLACASQGNFTLAHVIYKERKGVIRCTIDEAFGVLAISRRFNTVDFSDLMAQVLMRNRNIQELNYIVKEAARRKEKALLVQFFKDAPVMIDIDAIIENPSLIDEKGMFALAQEENSSQKRKCNIQ
ncbi:hypothetical protein [Candidatus Berkiella aquae]|uniref:F-box domain-containing protein n=1 Tax=Candidatus Berkiella aquae TaxID=295108 RepID=A0A0Q9YGA0_9GAMM|nr:hypothetical protein [Candidatus Berkiella aquae]MCS5709931.1 hypothetical protein [Candidatus Berkiella aquae]